MAIPHHQKQYNNNSDLLRPSNLKIFTRFGGQWPLQKFRASLAAPSFIVGLFYASCKNKRMNARMPPIHKQDDSRVCLSAPIAAPKRASKTREV
ncbi:hypothetical protein GE21DRAFT_1293244, partial [Neurospora crassa]